MKIVYIEFFILNGVIVYVHRINELVSIEIRVMLRVYKSGKSGPAFSMLKCMNEFQ